MLVWHYNCKSGDAAYHENMVIKKFFDKTGTLTEGKPQVTEVYPINIGENDLLKYCNPILINKKKLKVNYRYDVNGFLNDTRL